jgi:hypothetical protein
MLQDERRNATHVARPLVMFRLLKGSCVLLLSSTLTYPQFYFYPWTTILLFVYSHVHANIALVG